VKGEKKKEKGERRKYAGRKIQKGGGYEPTAWDRV